MVLMFKQFTLSNIESVMVLTVIVTVVRWVMVMGLGRYHVHFRADGRIIIADSAAPVVVSCIYFSERGHFTYYCVVFKFDSTANNIVFAAKVETDLTLCRVFKLIRDCSYVADAATAFVLVG